MAHHEDLLCLWHQRLHRLLRLQRLCDQEYFANYFLHMSDVTFDMRFNQMNVHSGYAEPWRVTLVDTGEGTMTGGASKRVREHIGNESFCFTYGDGLSNVNIRELIEFHHAQGNLATLTSPGLQDDLAPSP